MVHDMVRADSVSYSGSSLIYEYTVLYEEGGADNFGELEEIRAIVTSSSSDVMNSRCDDPEWTEYFESGGTFRLTFRFESGDVFADYELGFDDCSDRMHDITR